MDWQTRYDRAGTVTGWDFSRLSVIKKGRAWHFYDKVGDKLNIKEAFGRGQAYAGHVDGPSRTAYIEALCASGFEVEMFEYDAVEHYAGPGDLVFLLRNTPIIPDFGRDEIETNSKRYILVARRL